VSEILSTGREVKFGDLLISKSGTYVVIEHRPGDDFCTVVGSFYWRGSWDWVRTRLGARATDARRAIS
jgi:hypothetical protein